MKRTISILLCFIMIVSSFSFAASADSATELKFDENGKFNILHLADCQDGYPASKKMFAYINTVLETEDIDLVVLGGDNTVGPKETKYEAIEELCKPFVEHKVYFTMVFGNHDHQQDVNKTDLFEMYKKAGGQYFLGFNCDKEIVDDPYDNAKVGTHYLPVYNSDSSEIKYCIYMFDSGNYVYDENGEELGYGSVDENQIAWYKSIREEMKDSSGKYIPSIAFQHIVPGEVYDKMFYPSAVDLGDVGRSFYGKNYTFVPRLKNFDGLVNEPPCPGYYNYGQMDALAEKGECKAVFVGHDHQNDYEVDINGVKVFNSPSITYNSYSSSVNHGARMISLDEKTGDFETYLITVNDLVLLNSDYAEKIDMTTSEAKFNIFMYNLMNTLHKIFSIIF